MRAFRVYADTSVFGGVFDEGFAPSSLLFFEQVRDMRFELVSSTLVRDELLGAPRKVQEFFSKMTDCMEFCEVHEDAVALQEAYLAAGIVGESSTTDALHVALATVLGCRMIVSWNFRHIVHFQKIPLYNGVNRVMAMLRLRSTHPWRWCQMSAKSFDCVKMKQKGAQKILEALRGKTPEQQVEYWRHRNAEMQRWLLRRDEKAEQKSGSAAVRGAR